MRVIISYMARDDDGDGAMHTYTTQRTHTRLTYALIRTPTPACIHACTHACSSRPPRTAMRHCICHHPHRTPQYTLHLHICCTTAHPQHIATHPTPNTLQHTHTATYRSLRATAITTRPESNKRQHRHTHITPTAITTTI